MRFNFWIALAAACALIVLNVVPFVAVFLSAGVRWSDTWLRFYVCLRSMPGCRRSQVWGGGISSRIRSGRRCCLRDIPLGVDDGEAWRSDVAGNVVSAGGSEEGVGLKELFGTLKI